MQSKLTEKSVAALEVPADAAQLVVWDTELTGFGVVVGKTARTFVVQGRVSGTKVRKAIAVLGRIRDDGAAWTVLLARQRAREELGKMAAGVNPNAPARNGGGPTLRDGLELHVSNMRKRGCSARSIGTIETEVPRLLASWLDRPIAELTGADVVKLHDKLTGDGKPYLANRIVAQVSAVWNALDRVHELEGRNPARAVTRNRYVPSRKRIDDGGMADWYTKVLALPSPVRRDLQLFCLFTGMRSEAARRVRWENIDEDTGALVVPKPKGGEAKAFTLPLPKTILEMLEARRADNEKREKDGVLPGGDGGWVFASLARDQKQVQPIAEPKEYRRDPDTKQKVSILPGLHTLRRTYLSVATEAGVSEIDRHVLVNHAFGRQNVNATYIEQAFDHLAECQAKIETALWQRLTPDPKAKRGKAKLRAV